ncbi:MAG: EAL domain-containing protein [Pseudomonadota bacterium]
MRTKYLQRIIDFIPRLRPWQISAVAIVLTVFIVSWMSLFFHGRVTLDYIITGIIAALLVSYSTFKIVHLYQEELRSLHKHNQLLLDSAGEGIFGLNSNGCCTFINKAALEMLGYLEEELIGRNIHQIIHHTYSDGSTHPVEECPMLRVALEGKEARVKDDVLWRSDGELFPAEYSAHPIVDADRHHGAVIVFRNVSEDRAIAKKMHYLANHDPLTGLMNRFAFERQIEQALRGAISDGSEHVLCYLDLDQFKLVNDTCGHVAGDELLRQISALLHADIRQGDHLGRLGGDEFGVMLMNCSLDDSLAIIDMMRRTVQDFRFVWDRKVFVIGVSAGAVAITRDTQSTANALSMADTACYVAKENGRNRVHIHKYGDTELAWRHGEMHWVAKIHEALEENRFILNFQTIISLEPAMETGAMWEILVALRDQHGNIVPPGAFIPAAERYNLMTDIDRWVVRRFFDWFVAHKSQLENMEFCSINLSGSTLADEKFLEFILTEFKRTSIPPQKICFEITETTAIADLARSVRLINELKRLGCRFALDDFGSGMSSFGYLKNLPVDFIKIDGNFVRNISTDNIDLAIVEAINQVGHVMGIQTIAEFVMDEETLTMLTTIGVDYAQGYGIGKPELLEPDG